MRPSRLPTMRRISTLTWYCTPWRKRVAAFIEDLIRGVAGH